MLFRSDRTDSKMAETQETPNVEASAEPTQQPAASVALDPQSAPPQASPSAPSNARELTSQREQPKSLKELHAEFKALLYGNTRFSGAFEKLELKTGAKREHAAYGALALLTAYLIFGRAAQLVSNAIGFAYPVFASVKAIRTEDKSDDTLWLTYWTVFGLFSVLDFWVEGIMSVFPVYLVLKSCFLLYLSLPQTRGAQKLYAKVVDPAITRIEARFAAKKE